MRKMIIFIKWDFWRVKAALECLVRRQIPMWVAVLYYCILGALVLPFAPLLWIYVKIRLHFAYKAIDKLGEV